jgi:tetratricopeptide (TPR) repeat protein
VEATWLAAVGVVLLVAGLATLVYDIARRRRDTQPYPFPDSTTRHLDETAIQAQPAPVPPTPKRQPTTQLPSIDPKLEEPSNAAASQAPPQAVRALRKPRLRTAIALVVLLLACLSAAAVAARISNQPSGEKSVVVGIAAFAGDPANLAPPRLGDSVARAASAGAIPDFVLLTTQARPTTAEEAEAERARIQADLLWWGRVGLSGEITASLSLGPSFGVRQQPWQRFTEMNQAALVFPRQGDVYLPSNLGLDPLVPLTLALAHLESGNFSAASRAASGARATLDDGGGMGQIAAFIEATSLISTGENEAALQSFARMESAGAMWPEALANRAFLRLQMGDYSGAIADADRVLADRSATTRAMSGAYLARGRAHIGQGEHIQAVADLDQCIALDSNDPLPRLDKAEALYRQSQPDAALSELEQVVRREPQAAPAYRLMGLVRLMLAQPDKAQQALAQAERLYSGWLDRLRTDEARAQVAGDTAQAQLATEGIIRLNRELAAVYLYQGMAAADKARKESAETFLGGVWRNLRGEPTTNERALAKMQEAARLDPKRPDIPLQMAGVYTNMGDTAKAAESLQAARALNAAAPEPYLALARLQTAQGNPQEAINTLNELLSYSPGYYPAYQELYDTYTGMGDAESATASLQRGLQVAPNTPADHLWRGKFLKTLGAHAEATAEFSMAAQDPQLWEAHLELGRAMQESGRATEALAEFRQVLAVQPNHPVALLEAGRLLANAGDAAKAQELFDRLTRLYPANADGHISYLQLLIRMGEIQRAVAEGQRAVQADAARADTHFYLAEAYEVQGDWPHAAEQYKATVERDPAHFEALIRLARSLFNDDRYLDSMQASQSAINLRSTDPQPYRWKAEAQLALGDSNGALASLQTALELSPNYADALALASRACTMQGNLPAAVDYAGRATQGDPNNSAGALSLGETYLIAGRHQEALQAFGAALQASPTSARALIGQGRARNAMNDQQSALKLYADALEVGGADGEAHLYAGHAYSERGQWNDALREYRSAVQVRPQWPVALYYLGKTYTQRRDLQNAQAAFARATQFSPNFVEAWFGLGITYRESGHRKEAIDALSHAVQLNSGYADAWLYLGLTHEEMGDRAAAMQAFTQARDTAHDPNIKEQAEKGIIRVR